MNASQQAANRTLLKRLSVVVVAMFGFGYLMVPFYEKICEVTGLRNIARADTVANTQVDASRVVRIEFDSNVHNLPWRFRSVERGMSVHPGAVAQAEFEVVNTTDRPITGQAIPSYAPQYAAQYFRKLDCFCFSQQTLQPGEVRRLPVVFVVETTLPDEVNYVTMSYTFFEVEGRARSDALPARSQVEGRDGAPG